MTHKNSKTFDLSIQKQKLQLKEKKRAQSFVFRQKWRQHLSFQLPKSSLPLRNLLLQLEQEPAWLLHPRSSNNKEGESCCWNRQWRFRRFWIWKKLRFRRRVRWKSDRTYHRLRLTLPSSSSKPNLPILLLSAQVMPNPTLLPLYLLHCSLLIKMQLLLSLFKLWLSV